MDKSIKANIAEQIRGEIDRQGITTIEMAKRMRTSRATIWRILNDDNLNVSLRVLCNAAAALGKSVRIELK